MNHIYEIGSQKLDWIGRTMAGRGIGWNVRIEVAGSLTSLAIGTEIG